MINYVYLDILDVHHLFLSYLQKHDIFWQRMRNVDKSNTYTGCLTKCQYVSYSIKYLVLNLIFLQQKVKKWQMASTSLRLRSLKMH